MAQSKPFLINDYPVIIGIDFGNVSLYMCVCVCVCTGNEPKAVLTKSYIKKGTTFSGCSYAFIQNDEVVDVVRW